MNGILFQRRKWITPRVSGLPFLAALSVAFLLGAQVTLQAAPMTFAFEAEISSVSLGIPFDSGIDFSVGDTISGQFTFEPFEEDCAVTSGPIQPLGCTRLQSNTFLVDVNGTEIESSSYEINVLNNGGVTGFPQLTDLLQPRGGGLMSQSAAGSINIDSASSGFSMSLVGPTDSIEFASIPGSPLAWNQFNLERSLNITLRDGHGGAIGFQADVSQFFVIPEPSCLCLAILALATCTAPRCGRVGCGQINNDFPVQKEFSNESFTEDKL